MVLSEEVKVGTKVVGMGFVGDDGEEAVEGAADGSLVLRGLLGAGGVLGSGTAGLLAGLASLGTDVLEVLLADVAGVVFSVLTGGTMCGTVVFLGVEAGGRKAQGD